MVTSQKNRKLSAILSADVKGYSLLMADNELATIDTLKAHKETMTALIQDHNGRVVDTPGDNLMAEFASAMDAVSSAIARRTKPAAIPLYFRPVESLIFCHNSVLLRLIDNFFKKELTNA